MAITNVQCRFVDLTAPDAVLGGFLRRAQGETASAIVLETIGTLLAASWRRRRKHLSINADIRLMPWGLKLWGRRWCRVSLSWSPRCVTEEPRRQMSRRRWPRIESWVPSMRSSTTEVCLVGGWRSSSLCSKRLASTLRWVCGEHEHVGVRSRSRPLVVHCPHRKVLSPAKTTALSHMYRRNPSR